MIENIKYDISKYVIDFGSILNNFIIIDIVMYRICEIRIMMEIRVLRK